MKKVKWVSVLAAALLIAGLAVAGCTFGAIPGEMGGTEGASGNDGGTGGGGEGGTGGGGIGQVAALTANPGAGAISAGQTITLASATGDAAIRYTIDGTTPTASNGTIYSGAFTLPSLPATVKAIAYKAGMTDSAVLTATYTVLLPSYTMILIPAGTVNTTNTGTGNTTNWGAGANTAYAKPYTMTAFKMGETEVTYELWNAVKTWATANGYTFANAGRQGGDTGSGPVGTDQHPVTTISWRDAVVWCNAYSEAKGLTPYYLDGATVLRESEGIGTAPGSGKAEQATFNASADGYRLPTEAQWEYAARGGVPSNGTPWTYTYAGSNTVTDVAVYNTSATAALKSKTGGSYNGANSADLYDMSGNVYEFCQDIFSGTLRVLRGGGWNDIASDCEVFDRSGGNPGLSNYVVGFRVVCP